LNVLLIDIDSKIPNLALMQISAYHKGQGDTVGFDVPDPDKIYISCVFTKNRPKALGIARLYQGTAEIFIGGSGINYDSLPEKMQKVKPDYELYGSTYSLGFTTRGCIRNCPFCIVRKKEGEYRRWQHIRDFHDGNFDKVVLLDNNWYADKEWFMDNTKFLIDNNLKVQPTQGMDIRLLDREIADRLRMLKKENTFNFAWDNIKDEPAIRTGIQILKDAGFDVRHEIQFYVLIGFNSTFDEDLYRCRILKLLNTNAFVMPYVRNRTTRKLARWANRKHLFWSIDFVDFKEVER
jgi:radical SAM superfamily enzyme YgiQ (UPF0313 family)